MLREVSRLTIVLVWVSMGLSGLVAQLHLLADCKNARHWEELKILGLGTIFQIAYSPDGFRLVVASSIGVVIWNTEKGVVERMLVGHTASVESVAWSPDGSMIASGSAEIKIWNADSGELLLTITESANSVAWSPDSSKIISSSRDHTLKVWETEMGSLTQTLSGHSATVWSVVWSPDGSKIASGSEDRTIKVWDAESGAVIRTLTGHTLLVRSVEWSPNGCKLVSGSSDSSVRVWGTRE